MIYMEGAFSDAVLVILTSIFFSKTVIIPTPKNAVIMAEIVIRASTPLNRSDAILACALYPHLDCIRPRNVIHTRAIHMKKRNITTNDMILTLTRRMLFVKIYKIPESINGMRRYGMNFFLLTGRVFGAFERSCFGLISHNLVKKGTAEESIITPPTPAHTPITILGLEPSISTGK